ncbi:divalent-cation tolerance protein CutA [Aquabacterium sp.]|uniref:divalent-cation tolerance protein CutA n=1 Tax=Aquabacterium sp. TaxID=1872578 RepID=UPI0035B287FA
MNTSNPQTQPDVNRDESVKNSGILVLIQCPVPSEDEADAIADALLSKHLAASIHVRSVHSRYRWDGTVVSKIEYVLDIKTLGGLFEQVVEIVRRMHPYKVPGIWALPVESVTTDYCEWMHDACTQP